MKKRFSDEEIVKILQEAEGGTPMRDVCRNFNVTEQTFYRWRKQFAGMAASVQGRVDPSQHETCVCAQIVYE